MLLLGNKNWKCNATDSTWKIRVWNINWIDIIGVHIGTKKHNWEIDDFISSNCIAI
jgi:hypothetical protein